VEIISPSSRSIDRVRKMALYARAGVPEYWIADPEQRAFVVYVLEGEDYVPVAPNPDGTISSRVFPGLLVDLAEVFANLD
jgi:Uma2 family endonuclease